MQRNYSEAPISWRFANEDRDALHFVNVQPSDIRDGKRKRESAENAMTQNIFKRIHLNNETVRNPIPTPLPAIHLNARDYQGLHADSQKIHSIYDSAGNQNHSIYSKLQEIQADLNNPLPKEKIDSSHFYPLNNILLQKFLFVDKISAVSNVPPLLAKTPDELKELNIEKPVTHITEFDIKAITLNLKKYFHIESFAGDFSVSHKNQGYPILPIKYNTQELNISAKFTETGAILYIKNQKRLENKILGSIVITKVKFPELTKETVLLKNIHDAHYSSLYSTYEKNQLHCSVSFRIPYETTWTSYSSDQAYTFQIGNRILKEGIIFIGKYKDNEARKLIEKALGDDPSKKKSKRPSKIINLIRQQSWFAELRKKVELDKANQLNLLDQIKQKQQEQALRQLPQIHKSINVPPVKLNFHNQKLVKKMPVSTVPQAEFSFHFKNFHTPNRQANIKPPKRLFFEKTKDLKLLQNKFTIPVNNPQTNTNLSRSTTKLTAEQEKRLPVNTQTSKKTK